MTRRERLEKKLEKRREWATSRAAKAETAINSAVGMVSGIPMGQPILVGHHSERGHRALLARSDNKMRQGVEHNDMAQHHASKANGLESQLDGSIFSDDPDAIEALEAKVKELEAEQAEGKRMNAYYRKHKTMVGYNGLSEEAGKKIDERIAVGYSWDRRPVASYTLSNRNARISQAKKRIKQIEARQSRAIKAEAAGGVVVEGTGEYCRVTFSEKPERSVINDLKAANFHWGAGSWSGRRDALPASVLEIIQEQATA